jgi:hypothetical protein
MSSSLREILGNYWLFLVLATVLAAGFLAFRSRPTELSGEAALDSLLQDGQPAIVELYSNF